MLIFIKKKENIFFVMKDFFTKKIIHQEEYDKSTVLDIIEDLKELTED